MATETKRSGENADLLPDQVLRESQAVFAVEGMTCASCAMRIEKGLKKVPGIKDASVNLATEKATVTYDPTQTTLTQMVRSVEAVGYQATPQTEAPAPDPATQQETGADSPASLAMGFS